MDEFDLWWEICPYKVNKLEAKRKYIIARQIATQEELYDGMKAYRKGKPSWQKWCGPEVWLHRGRWLDEWGDDGEESELDRWLNANKARRAAKEKRLSGPESTAELFVKTDDLITPEQQAEVRQKLARLGTNLRSVK